MRWLTATPANAVAPAQQSPCCLCEPCVCLRTDRADIMYSWVSHTLRDQQAQPGRRSATYSRGTLSCRECALWLTALLNRGARHGRHRESCRSHRASTFELSAGGRCHAACHSRARTRIATNQPRIPQLLKESAQRLRNHGFRTCSRVPQLLKDSAPRAVRKRKNCLCTVGRPAPRWMRACPLIPTVSAASTTPTLLNSGRGSTRTL
jgi:hypothetical protein